MIKIITPALIILALIVALAGCTPSPDSTSVVSQGGSLSSAPVSQDSVSDSSLIVEPEIIGYWEQDVPYYEDDPSVTQPYFEQETEYSSPAYYHSSLTGKKYNLSSYLYGARALVDLYQAGASHAELYNVATVIDMKSTWQLENYPYDTMLEEELADGWAGTMVTIPKSNCTFVKFETAQGAWREGEFSYGGAEWVFCNNVKNLTTCVNRETLLPEYIDTWTAWTAQEFSVDTSLPYVEYMGIKMQLENDEDAACAIHRLCRERSSGSSIETAWVYLSQYTKYSIEEINTALDGYHDRTIQWYKNKTYPAPDGHDLIHETDINLRREIIAVDGLYTFSYTVEDLLNETETEIRITDAASLLQLLNYRARTENSSPVEANYLYTLPYIIEWEGYTPAVNIYA